MTSAIRRRSVATILVLTGWAFAHGSDAAAQSLGTFRWQLQPFCNVITVTVTQVGGTYRLEGVDDQCGAVTQASVIGTAFLNANGTIGLGFTVVATPGGAPLAVDATVTLPAVQGTWRDSAGRTGDFIPAPGPATGGLPRPLSAGLGAAAVDTTQIQRRIADGCPVGQAVRTVNQDGTVVCQSTSGGGGTITGVRAGAGLTGGGTSGAVGLDVAFAGTGAANTVARSDHRHTLPRVVTVAPAGGDFTSVAAALASITDATETNTYLVQVMPGVYTETGLVEVKSFVHLRGSGPGTTVITSGRTGATPAASAATVALLEAGRISELNVRNTGTGNIGVALYSSLTTGATVVETVTAEAIGAGGVGHFAAYWHDAEATIRNSTLAARGATGFGVAVNTAFGSVNLSGAFPQALIERSVLLGGAGSSIASCNDNTGTGFGLQLSNSTPIVRDSAICAGHRGVASYTNGDARIQGSTIQVSSTGSAFLFEIASTATISVANSGVSYVGNKVTGTGTGLRCVHTYNAATWAPLSDGTTAATACN
jgi:hypothetical protein